MFGACSANDETLDTPLDETTMDCDAEPIVRTTADGIDFLRTPDARFADLVDWPFEARYVELDGLRQAYVDEGPADGPVVLLLHGQPSWSYLYRKMIPPLVDAGFRVIAMDHLGMGRSDKPLDVDEIRFLVHSDRLIRFIEALELTDINLFAQDCPGTTTSGDLSSGSGPNWPGPPAAATRSTSTPSTSRASASSSVSFAISTTRSRPP
jgi:hypothetical protein